MRSTLLAATAALVLSSPGMAQTPQFQTPFGAPLDAAPGLGVTTVNLGHSFTMPGGNVVTQLDIVGDGRIRAGGAGAPFLGFNPSTFLTPAGGTIMVHYGAWGVSVLSPHDVWFDTNATRSLVTWVREIGSNDRPHVVQAQLYADGRIVIATGAALALPYVQSGYVGVSSGSNASASQTDLTTSFTAPIVTPSKGVFEHYTSFLPNDYRLSAFEFTPNGPGGVNGWTVTGNDDVDRIDPPLGRIVRFGKRCYETRTIDMVWTGNGYFVTTTPGGFNHDLGEDMGFLFWKELRENVNLGFPFPFPDGTYEQLVDVDSNGRILPANAVALWDSNVGSFVDFWPGGYPMVCTWMDLSLESGRIHMRTAPGEAQFTWSNVLHEQARPNQEPVTFQITLFSDGNVRFTLHDMTGFYLPPTVPSWSCCGREDVLIGVFDGTPITGPEVDLSAATGVQVGTQAYEYFDLLDLFSFEVFDFDGNRDHPILRWDSLPQFGTSWDLRIDKLPPAATTGFLFFGFAQQLPELPLDSIGMLGCSFQVIDSGITALLPPSGLGDTQTYSIAVPTDPVHLGLTFYVQGGCDGAPFAPAPLYFTDSLACTVGY